MSCGFQISDKIRLEAELERQEEQLRELQRRYSAAAGPQVRLKSNSSAVKWDGLPASTKIQRDLYLNQRLYHL